MCSPSYSFVAQGLKCAEGSGLLYAFCEVERGYGTALYSATRLLELEAMNTFSVNEAV